MRLMAIDYGDARTGVAFSDPTGLLAGQTFLIKSRKEDAVLAELDIAGDPIGVGTIHLENRTSGEGREKQLTGVLEAAEKFFPKDMPVILGGDLNTNTYDGCDKKVVLEVAASEELRRRCLEEVPEWENCLRVAENFGYTLVPTTQEPTRRKTLPDGSWLPLRLDWFLLRGVSCEEYHIFLSNLLFVFLLK